MGNLLHYAIVFLVVALVAALFGFGGVAGDKTLAPFLEFHASSVSQWFFASQFIDQKTEPAVSFRALWQDASLRGFRSDT